MSERVYHKDESTVKAIGIAMKKNWGEPTESYGNEKCYYLWVHKQSAKHTPSRGSGGMPPQENFWKISAIRLNLEAILANNFMLLSIL